MDEGGGSTLSVKDRIKALRLQEIEGKKASPVQNHTPEPSSNGHYTGHPRGERNTVPLPNGRPSTVSHFGSENQGHVTQGRIVTTLDDTKPQPPVPIRPGTKETKTLPPRAIDGKPETSTVRNFFKEKNDSGQTVEKEEVFEPVKQGRSIPASKPKVPPRPVLVQTQSQHPPRPALPQRPSQTAVDAVPSPPLPARPQASVKQINTSEERLQEDDESQRYVLTADDEKPMAQHMDLRLEEIWFTRDPPQFPPVLVEASQARMRAEEDPSDRPTDFQAKFSVGFEGDDYTAIYACIYSDYSRYNLKLEWNKQDPYETVSVQDVVYPPPEKPSLEYLLECSRLYGQWIQEFCVQNEGVKLRSGICNDLVLEALDSLKEVMKPQVENGDPDILSSASGHYGPIIYMDRGPQWTSDVIPRCRRNNDTEIRGGDIVWLGPNTSFEWHDGTSPRKMAAGPPGHVAIVSHVEKMRSNPVKKVAAKTAPNRSMSAPNTGIGAFTSTFLKSGVDKAWADSKSARRDTATMRSYQATTSAKKVTLPEASAPKVKDIFEDILHVYEQNASGRTIVGRGVYRLNSITHGKVRIFRIVDQRWTIGTIEPVFPQE